LKICNKFLSGSQFTVKMGAKMTSETFVPHHSITTWHRNPEDIVANEFFENM